MKQKILIVEDLFVEANHLRIILTRAGYQVTGIARTFEEARELVRTNQPDIALLDIMLAGKKNGIELAKCLNQQHIPFIFLSANSSEDILREAKATRPSGFIVKPFREKDLLISLEIAEYLHQNSNDAQLRKEAVFLQDLKTLAENGGEWTAQLLGIVKAFQRLIPFDYVSAGFFGKNFLPFKGMHFLRIGFDEYQAMDAEGLRMVTNVRAAEMANMMAALPPISQVEYYNAEKFRKMSAEIPLKKLIAGKFDMRSNLVMPIANISIDGKQFFFCFYSRRPDAFGEQDLELCARLQPAIESAIRKMIRAASTSGPDMELDHAIEVMAGSRSESPVFDSMVGQSHLMLNILDLISQVAPSDTSVLITGESGTGKEHVADTIHQLSPRKSKPFVKVNCAALPINLIESELFGHEKGAFTGATEKRIGRFEQADGGTIFLDEIGDMPLEVQVKLLRVLQQREIERVGGTQPIKINIRVITATNRNLERAIAEGKFRLDLYYRLNVFPIAMPALRERTEDIAPLVHHFIGYFGRKTGKNISGISDRALAMLMDYGWPGNIRELENVIERSVLLAKGTSIDTVYLPAHPAVEGIAKAGPPVLKNIFENERDHIISVLKACEGRISGENGAAKILAIPPTTLSSKMKKLGIKKSIGF
ncbi:MAG: sigma 54-interacting transcriptional regulator [Dyadobacter fermentans]